MFIYVVMLNKLCKHASDLHILFTKILICTNSYIFPILVHLLSFSRM